MREKKRFLHSTTSVVGISRVIQSNNWSLVNIYQKNALGLLDLRGKMPVPERHRH